MSGPERDPEQAILQAWQCNAAPWTRAVRGAAIASRRLVTDAAILAAVARRRPRTAIDLGCGEGWLAHALARDGIAVLGIDAVPALVAAAEAGGPGRFRVLDYDAIAAGMLDERADVAVCNFSLLGGASVDALLRAMPRLLEPGGALVVQTLHPAAACGEQPYRDGWREGSWAGCGEGFAEAAPWYFRTFAGWLASFRAAGLQLIDLVEPLHPETARPASVIFTLGLCDQVLGAAAES
ncbi:class I SAM-dependent methyltransferase [Fulvimonas yonginensis]|uniref:Methyltransferase domain-containing protein n=1 Tax=Fulvimonas yonginensis TaxID=1495200 RepID=A0ABU8JFW3_9GAMM